MKKNSIKLEKLCERLILRGETYDSIAEQILGISAAHLRRLRNEDYEKEKTILYYIGILERRLGL